MQTGQPLPAWCQKELTRIFEQVFQRWSTETQPVAEDSQAAAVPLLSVVGCTSLAEVSARNAAAVQALVDDLWHVSLSVSRAWPGEVKQRGRQIIGRAVHAFFYNDLYQATQLFMRHAEGTFGLVTSSSLKPGAVVLAADRQPLFVGADPTAGMLLFASEAAALKVVCGPGRDGRPRPIPYRFDLHDGDLVLLQAREDTADNSMTLLNQHSDGAAVERPITPQSLAASAREGGPRSWIALRDNPWIEPATTAPSLDHRHDRVLAEMLDVPRVLDRVQCDWDDPASLNRRTERAFSEHLLLNAQAAQTRDQGRPGSTINADLDLLVLGVENSLYVGQRFVQDLLRILPNIHARAVDAVSYCEEPQRYGLGPETITLAMSHSGQTFNTLDAVKFIQALHLIGKTGPIFVMTGEIDTLMGAAVGQRVNASAKWNERVLSTWGGWRTAEPATVSTAAMHASLTQLLLRLTQTLHAEAGAGKRPFGLMASEDDLAKLDALARLSVSRAEAIFGRSAEGWELQTEERDGLLQQGRYMARLITEPALAFIATALHLFLMLWLGWNPVIGAQDLLFSATGWPAFDAGTPVGSVLKVSFETAYFLFAGVAFMLMLRWLQGRRLWDRVFVGRTLVVGDEPYVKNLLSQFVSKLFSLAYEFAGFAAIHAADTRSGDMLHTFGHRITRGLLLYLGLPDGRWPGRERAEAAVHMTSSQARGVQSMGTGATVFGIGHNPGSADKIDRFIHLGLSARRAEALPWMLRGHWSELARELQESRFASFERLLASYVVFHCAAATTRDLMNRLVPLANLIWSPVFYSVKLLTGGRVRVRFGYWNLARTQSGTRIATTAAPVPANIHAPEQYLTPVERYAGAASAVERGAEAEIPVPESLAAPAKPVWVPPQAALPKASLFHLLPLVVLVCLALALALSGALGPPAFI